MRLTEFTDSYLYHATSFIKFDAIAKTDRLDASSSAAADMIGTDVVSFTRNLNYAKWYAMRYKRYKHPVIIVIDRNKLSSNYKITPYNHSHHVGRIRTDNTNDIESTNQYEEVVAQDIAQIHRYIVDVKFLSDKEPTIAITEFLKKLY